MIYLDNSATTRVSAEAAGVAYRYMTEGFFNPASAYTAAVNIERDTKTARATLAATLGCTPDEIIYTSGGTESNNAAILGTIKLIRGKGRILCSAVEHPSVYEVFSMLESMGYEWVKIPVTPDGVINYTALSELVTPDTLLVSIMHVNNETGAINDLARCNSIIKSIAPRALFHSDGVQAYCKMPYGRPNCDMYSISGHKLHAPKGIGALYVSNGVKFFGSLIGGGQERGLRSGTTNVPGIMAMDVAINDYRAHQAEYISNMYACKEKLARNLMTMPNVVINGPEVAIGAPHILNASFIGIRGEVLLHSLSDKSIYVSTGSACSTHKKHNRILEALGVSPEKREGAIRFSLAHDTTVADIDEACAAIDTLLPMLRKFKRR